MGDKRNDDALVATITRVLFFAAAATTVIPGILHLNMGLNELLRIESPPVNAGSTSHSSNVTSGSTAPQSIPAERGSPPSNATIMLTPIFFSAAGIIQIFWAVPMIRRWGNPWYYAGIGGTGFLIALWSVTKMNGNPITGRGAPVTFGIYDEIFEGIFIAITITIVVYASRMKRLDSKTAADAV